LRDRFLDAAAPITWTAGVFFLFGWAFTTGPAGSLDPAYLALCFVLTAIPVTATAAAAAVSGSPRVLGPALWVGLSFALLVGPRSSMPILANVPPAVGAALAAAAYSVRSAWAPAPAMGIQVAMCLAIPIIACPGVLHALELTLPGSSTIRWLQLLLCAGLFLALDRYNAGRRRLPALPSATALSLLVLLLLAPTRFLFQLRDPWFLGPPAAGLKHPPVPPRPNVILLILDTVRADRMSVYGFSRDTTPELRRFLARNENAVLATRAVAPATWTLPTHATLFTGLMPAQHGIHARSVYVDGSLHAPTLRADETLAERLRSIGYRTAFVYANAFLELIPSLGRGFDWHAKPIVPEPFPNLGERTRAILLPGLRARHAWPKPPAREVRNGVLRFLDSCTDEPCFVVANFMEAHARYVARAPFAGSLVEERIWAPLGPADMEMDDGERQWLDGRYQEAILELDFELGVLLRDLESSGLLATSWLVITSDHGEAFGEHGATEHGSNLFHENVWVPLIVKPPGGVRFELTTDAVSLLDLPATIAGWAGAPGLGSGRDLSEAAPSTATIEFNRIGRRQHGIFGQTDGRAVLHGGWKLIDHGPIRALYAVTRDPFEQRDVIDANRDVASRLSRLLPTLEAPRRPDEGRADLSDVERDRLRALGYVE
jgi:arylsulfatase A-like enzyme